MEWVYDDGGRSKYFKGKTGDCVCRAISIATGQDYKRTYDELAALNKKRSGKKSARNGVDRRDIRAYMAGIGWEWHPTMGIGTGCKVHLDADELPSGRIVCSLSGHLVAVIDGVLHDTYDSAWERRCVYGYWTAPKPKPKPVPTMGHEEFVKALEAVREDFEGGYMSEREFAQQCERLAHERSGRPYRRDAR